MNLGIAESGKGELGETQTELARKLSITQPAVSLSVRRGERLVKEMGLELGER